jgi:hypothetical protein
MTNETATATEAAEANWEAAHTAWEQAKADRRAGGPGDNVYGALDRVVDDAEKAMTEARDEWSRIEKAARIAAFVAAEDRKRNWAI